MLSQNAQEEAKLMAMQRVWQSKRGLSSLLLEEIAQTEELLSVPQVAAPNIVKPLTNEDGQSCCNDEEAEKFAYESLQEQALLQTADPAPAPTCTRLDAAHLGDFPARYTVCALEPHQLPVCGVYVDRRIAPGFKYRVRPLPAAGRAAAPACLFGGRALPLRSVGRGYARRFTFAADRGRLNANDNYFWGDSRPEGFAFELEAVSVGDKFTIFDADREPHGTIEVLQVEGRQCEISNVFSKYGIEKRANCKFTGKVEFFETGVAKPTPLNGVAVLLKPKHKPNAEITKVLNVVIKKQRYTLVPGIQKVHRRVTVRGEDINDVPTKYSMTGLEPYELPVVGTYVDPRVIPGFHYKVRPNDRRTPLFGGRALKLLSIGMGYAKRLTFQPDSPLRADNYLWSDNHPDGLGLEVRAVRRGMTFDVRADGQAIGRASVFRADAPQVEERMERVPAGGGRFAIEKVVLVDVMCHMDISGGGSSEEHLIRVCGRAVVRKEPHSGDAHVVRVENVGLDSQLNVLFAQTRAELTFHPRKIGKRFLY